MTDTVVSEGQVKFRDGKKWKSRWVVVQKPSPVADCLSVLVYKDKKKGKQKVFGRKDPLVLTLEGICGVEAGPGYDGVCFTLSVLCLANTLILGFRNRDALQAWSGRLRYSLGEVHSFSINVESGTKLQSGPATLHLCNNLLTLSRSLPPIVFGYWKLSALRRYGAVPNGFVFEGGTRCGYWAGVFFLSCSEGENISFLVDCIVRGITPSKLPHGLQPVLPGAPHADPVLTEERLDQEASELEKRLSMLSMCSLASSSASTYSCSTSVAGDDHSSISSSSSSQSETSHGKKLPFWADPLSRLHLPSETASGSSTPLKVMTCSDDRLYVAGGGGSATRPPTSHLRGLHDSGRQSSLDSGIGNVSGSQSSHTGSVSSSQEITSQEEEFGSFLSLPVAPPSSPPPPPSSASPCDEYRVPSVLSLHYDTPRSVLEASQRSRSQRSISSSRSWGSERAPPLDTERTNTPFAEEQENYITAEQWWLRSSALNQVGSRPSTPACPPDLRRSMSPLLTLTHRSAGDLIHPRTGTRDLEHQSNYVGIARVNPDPRSAALCRPHSANTAPSLEVSGRPPSLQTPIDKLS